jgi:hypothetical protein
VRRSRRIEEEDRGGGGRGVVDETGGINSREQEREERR